MQESQLWEMLAINPNLVEGNFSRCSQAPVWTGAVSHIFIFFFSRRQKLITCGKIVRNFPASGCWVSLDVFGFSSMRPLANFLQNIKTLSSLLCILFVIIELLVWAVKIRFYRNQFHSYETGPRAQFLANNSVIFLVNNVNINVSNKKCWWIEMVFFPRITELWGSVETRKKRDNSGQNTLNDYFL